MLLNIGFIVMYFKVWIVCFNGDMWVDGVKFDCEILDSVFMVEDEILLKVFMLVDNVGWIEKLWNNN